MSVRLFRGQIAALHPLTEGIGPDAVKQEHKTGNHWGSNQAEDRNVRDQQGGKRNAAGLNELLKRENIDVESSRLALFGLLLNLSPEVGIGTNVLLNGSARKPKNPRSWRAVCARFKALR